MDFGRFRGKEPRPLVLRFSHQYLIVPHFFSFVKCFLTFISYYIKRRCFRKKKDTARMTKLARSG